jgi:hypothetical protein
MTEVVTLATAVVVLATAVATGATAVVSLRTRRRVQEVHVLVNSRMQDMELRVRDLTAALTAEGMPVPPARDREEGT